MAVYGVQMRTKGQYGRVVVDARDANEAVAKARRELPWAELVVRVSLQCDSVKKDGSGRCARFTKSGRCTSHGGAG